MGFQDYWTRARSTYNERYSNSYRSFMLRWRQTQLFQTVDSLSTYKTIFENL